MLVAAAGGAVSALVVALVEGRSSAAMGGPRAASTAALVLADVGVLAPVALLASLAVGALAVFLAPDAPRSPEDYAASLRAQPVLQRSRTAAIAPLTVLTGFSWLVLSAQLARHFLSEGAPLAAGVELALASTATLAVLLVFALALLPSIRRLLAAGAARAPRLLDPVTTSAVAAAIAIACVAAGVHAGDEGGDGGGLLGIFGVWKRAELDLRPVVNLGAIALAAYAAPVALARGGVSWARAAVAAVVAILPFAASARAANALNREPEAARAIERGAPLGRIALAALRRATDRDRDGASPLFGGGDCDDRDRRFSPTAVDVPGNGVDEDCTGADLPAPTADVADPAAGAAPTDAIPDGLNVVLITIDTLRTDLGFMGYPKPVSPNLDKLAERGVIFDRAYAMASYTGKSVGPLLIGKFPSETIRNGSHFNTYDPANTLVTERLRRAGVRTFGAASHWYFNAWSGLTQGMQEWDLSAKPASGQGDTDTSVTSKELTDAALRLLAKPENTSSRFFMWVHYFDPHAQYDAHPGAPSFVDPDAPSAGGVAAAKAAYDGEVWFVDHHLGRLLDEIAARPWGARTAIVVTADHGEAFNDHNMSWHGGELWESLVRVPLLVVVPGTKPHHVAVKRSHIDLTPTILDLFKLPRPGPGELSGESMAGDLLAPEGAALPERDVYLDMPIGPYTAMRRGIIHGETPGMKLLHFGGNLYNLYDLAKDPGETTDLAGDRSRFEPVFEAFQAKRARLKEIEVKADPGDSP